MINTIVYSTEPDLMRQLTFSMSSLSTDCPQKGWKALSPTVEIITVISHM